MERLAHRALNDTIRTVTGPVTKGDGTMSDTMSMTSSAVEALRAAASYGFPPEKQERFAWLQAKNNEGTLTQAEADELQALVKEYTMRTLEKAKALLALQQQGGNTGASPQS